MTVGKGIGGGLAVSAVVGRAAFMSHWTPGAHTTTFMGNAVNLAAGRAAIGVLRDEAPRRSLGDARRARARALTAALADDPHVGEIRGLGLFIGIEIVADRESRAPDAERAAAIRRAAFERGVLLGGGGHHENVVKICPPLTIEDRPARRRRRADHRRDQGSPMTTDDLRHPGRELHRRPLGAGRVGRDDREPRPGDRRAGRDRAEVRCRGCGPGDRRGPGNLRRRRLAGDRRAASARRSCSSSPGSCARRPNRCPASSRPRWASRSATSASASSSPPSTGSCSTPAPPG